MRRVTTLVQPARRSRRATIVHFHAHALHRCFSTRNACTTPLFPLTITTTTPPPPALRAYATSAGPSTAAQPVSDSARQLAEHLSQHPEKASFMVRMVTKQVTSLAAELDAKGPHYDAKETIALLDALGVTLDAIKRGLGDTSTKSEVEEVIGRIVALRLEAQRGL